MKILVVDDHPLILEALQQILQQLDGEIEVHAARTADEGRTLVAAHTDADLLLLDLHLPEASGLGLLSELRNDFPDVPIVVLSGHDRREDILQALDNGAMGFIPKCAASDIMLHALRLILSGGIYVPPEIFLYRDADTRLNASMGMCDLGLTARQAQVFALMLRGKSNKVIGRELGLSEGTIKIHVAACLRALKVANRTQAIILASRMGLKIDDRLLRKRVREVG